MSAITGRKITQDILPLDLDSVPYMTTLGGQQFSDAYAKTYWQVPATGAVPATLTAQPFFESALGGSGGAYCQGYANCTSAVAAKNSTAFRNTAVADLWNALYKAPGWTLGRASIGQPMPGGATQGANYVTFGSVGWANYNGLYSTFRLRDFHGFTGTTNFTFSRALGTPTTAQSSTASTVLDTLNWENNYGVQSFDIKFMFNFSVTYSPKAFATQKGVIGHVLGGWRFAPMFTSQSGSPQTVTYAEGGCTGCQSYGEVSVASSLYKSITTNAVAVTPYAASTRVSYNNKGTSGPINGTTQTVGNQNPTGVNMFQDPAAALASYRRCVLGYDWSCAGYASRGLPYWNMDMGITKGIKMMKEGRGIDLRFNITNLFNHVYMGSPALVMTTPAQFGRITGVNTQNVPRQLQGGIRIYF